MEDEMVIARVYDFEEELETYEDLLKEKRKDEIVTEEFAAVLKSCAKEIFKKGSELTYLIADISSINAESFSKNLHTLHDYSGNCMQDIGGKEEDLDKLQKIYFAIRPRLINPSKEIGRSLTINLLKSVDPISASFLNEAVLVFNAGAYRSSAIMVGASLEKKLRKIYSERVGDDKDMKLNVLMDKLDSGGTLKKDEKLIFGVCQLFRDFSAHPRGDFKIDKSTAHSLIMMAQEMINNG